MFKYLLVVFIVASSSLTFAQDANHRLPREPIIVVTGNGEIDIKPDEAVVSLGATIQEKDAAIAQKKVNEIIQKSIDAITALGIKKEKIHTQSITLNPVYQPYQQFAPNMIRRPQKIIAFNASNQLQITLDDLSLIGPTIDAGVAAGADQIDGVDFSLQDDTSATQEALKRATLQAKAKADAIASALGESLGAAIEVDEGSVQRIMPMMAMRTMASEAMPSTPVQPGQIKITAQITVTYKIQPHAP